MAGSPPGPTMGSAPLVGAGKSFHRPIGVALISILMIIGGVVVVLVGIALTFLGGFVGTAFAGPIGAALGAALGIIILILGGIWLAAGLGLWRLKGWAWWLAAIVVLISIVGSIGSGYVGPVVGGLIFVYLLLVKKHFNQ